MTSLAGRLFWMACWRGSMDVVEMLLEARAEVAAADVRGHTPLRQACQEGHLDVVRVLLEAKADAKAEGEPLLYSASRSGNMELIRLLRKTDSKEAFLS
mmetsp:Transcript_60818/g.125932  ORF Transcript_60818/g.125932 Transcript_60818/m.125932 type:complete len:99 (-) Transcript_60818:46-342(-)